MNVSSGINPSEKPWPSGGKAWRTIAQAGLSCAAPPAPPRWLCPPLTSACIAACNSRGGIRTARLTLMTVSPLPSLVLALSAAAAAAAADGRAAAAASGPAAVVATEQQLGLPLLQRNVRLNNASVEVQLFYLFIIF